MFNIKVFLFSLLFYIAIINASDDELSAELLANTRATAIDSAITNLLECLRTLLREGNATIGLPSFDPLEINGAIRIPLNYDIISGVVTVSDLTLQGIPDFNASVTSSLGLLSGSVGINVTFESIKLQSGYVMDLIFMVAKLYGEGDLSIELQNLAAKISLQVRIIGSPFLGSPTFDLSLDDASIKITGFRNDDKMSDIISRQLEATVTSLIKEQQEVVSYYVEEIITNLLQNITLSSISSGGGLLNC